MNKKLFPILILLSAIVLFGYQIQTNSINSGKIISTTITSQNVIIQNDAPIYCDGISVNQFNTSAQPKIWFYVNLVIIILTPAVFK